MGGETSTQSMKGRHPLDREFRFFMPGTKVFVGPDFDIEGVVTGISIRTIREPRYEVGYWNGRDYVEKWFEAYQVKHDLGHATGAIGFRRHACDEAGTQRG